MKKFSMLGLMVLLLANNLISQDKNSIPVTVKSVDLKKYIGLWYEIAKIPNRFQKGCVCCTTAEYILQSDGTIKVINSCSENDGNMKRTEGVAKIVAGSNNSKLEVSFFSILGIRPFWGDYWIIGLDENYKFAVISSPDRKYGWILSRTKQLPDEKLKKVFSILEKNGYDPKKFEFTGQN